MEPIDHDEFMLKWIGSFDRNPSAIWPVRQPTTTLALRGSAVAGLRWGGRRIGKNEGPPGSGSGSPIGANPRPVHNATLRLELAPR